MKKKVFWLAPLMAAGLLLAGLVGCVMPDNSAEEPPEGALSFDDLLANLDALQGPASRSATQPDQTVFTMPSGSTLSRRDLSAYLSSVKNELASSIYATADGRPYLVVPVRLAWGSGDEVESALMWVPFTWGRPRSFPVISYQHGTQVYEDSAPSRFRPNPLSVLYSPDPTGALQNYVECIVGALMASAGYIVVMPDYVGFGASTVPDHPYVTMALGGSVTGALGAAETALSGKVVSPNGKVFLTGYSEGGYATMAGARAVQDAGGALSAIVPCDGAYDLSGTMLDQMLDKEVKVPSYLLYAASGYHALYPADVVYEDLLQEKWAVLLKQGLFDGTHTNAEIAALGLPPRPREMLTETAAAQLDVGAGPVYKRLAENDAWNGWIPMAPVIFVHCPQDDVVPYENATEARDALLAKGVPVLPIVDVPPVPFIDNLADSVHLAAYPTAMLAAYLIIDGLN
jgi:dienelactone hydrolase